MKKGLTIKDKARLTDKAMEKLLKDLQKLHDPVIIIQVEGDKVMAKLESGRN